MDTASFSKATNLIETVLRKLGLDPATSKVRDEEQTRAWRLLELNARTMRNASFGLLNDGVVIVSERPVEGLDANEVEQILKHVGALADHYDDEFIKEYGVAR